MYALVNSGACNTLCQFIFKFWRECSHLKPHSGEDLEQAASSGCAGHVCLLPSCALSLVFYLAGIVILFIGGFFTVGLWSTFGLLLGGGLTLLLAFLVLAIHHYVDASYRYPGDPDDPDTEATGMPLPVEIFLCSSAAFSLQVFLTVSIGLLVRTNSGEIEVGGLFDPFKNDFHGRTWHTIGMCALKATDSKVSKVLDVIQRWT
mmetsp:Transcript_31473/g.61800  ORF Transcript_31473/g.61800 Transcript_31473/m.61800 type:complete len:204 (+) Transcript_31473:415-1026(+)